MMMRLAMLVFHPIHSALAAALACFIASSLCYCVVQSFSPVIPLSMTQQKRYRRPSTKSTSMQLFEEYMSEDYNPPGNNDHGDDGNIKYGMGGIDLSQRWIELVSGGHIVANVDLSSDAAVDNEDDKLRVRYGVRLLDDEDDEQSQQRLSEFAEMILPPNEEKKEDENNNSSFIKLRNHIMSINTTLTEMQSSSGSSGMAIDCIYDGPYAIQLQLVRTLRPPRSKEMTGSSSTPLSSNSKVDEKDSCQPPPYDSSKDSFLVGPLRLFGHGEFHGEGNPREKAAQIAVPRNKADDETTTTSWDVYHNISPVDPRGHFLLLPDIGDKTQWRDQALNSNDCHDLTYLASTIEPRGSMVISFNSVSAGASQNHIHAHAWPNPPPPLLYRNDPTAEYDSVYAVTKASSLASIKLVQVNVSLLRYPCTCVKLSASLGNEEGKETSPTTLKEMSDTLSKIIAVAQKMQIPHNVVWTNSDQNIDTYIFFRKSETLQIDGNMFRLGASEMLGVFHSSSKEELFSVKKYRGLSCYGAVNVLSDISYEPTQHIWAEISSALGKTTSRRLMALKRAELYKKEKRSPDESNVRMSRGPRYLRTGVPYDTDGNDDDDV